jgi:hypothetical protein
LILYVKLVLILRSKAAMMLLVFLAQKIEAIDV